MKQNIDLVIHYNISHFQILLKPKMSKQSPDRVCREIEFDEIHCIFLKSLYRKRRFCMWLINDASHSNFCKLLPTIWYFITHINQVKRYRFFIFVDTKLLIDKIVASQATIGDMTFKLWSCRCTKSVACDCKVQFMVEFSFPCDWCFLNICWLKQQLDMLDEGKI